MGDSSSTVAGEEVLPGQAASGSAQTVAMDAWLAQATVREAPEAIVVTDPEGIIRLWNHGAERVFGHSAAQAVGESLDLIIPEKLRERHWAGYRQTMATGRTRYGDTLLSVPATPYNSARCRSSSSSGSSVIQAPLEVLTLPDYRASLGLPSTPTKLTRTHGRARLTGNVADLR